MSLQFKHDPNSITDFFSMCTDMKVGHSAWGLLHWVTQKPVLLHLIPVQI